MRNAKLQKSTLVKIIRGTSVIASLVAVFILLKLNQALHPAVPPVGTSISTTPTWYITWSDKDSIIHDPLQRIVLWGGGTPTPLSLSSDRENIVFISLPAEGALMPPSSGSTPTPLSVVLVSLQDLQELLQELQDLQDQVTSLQAEVATLQEELDSLASVDASRSGNSENNSGNSDSDNQLQAELQSVEERLSDIEQVILDSPERAIRLTRLDKEIKDLRAQYKSDIESLRQEIVRIYDLTKWFIGLMFTMAIGLLSLAVSNFIQRPEKSSKLSGERVSLTSIHKIGGDPGENPERIDTMQQ